MKINVLVVAMATTLSLSGCATVFDGGAQSVNLLPSLGSNVKVKITSKGGTREASLPTVVSLPRAKSDIVVVVDDPCYEQSQMVSSPQLDPWAIGNVIFGVFGLTGTTVDMQSGNAWKYESTITVPTSKKASCRKK